MESKCINETTIELINFLAISGILVLTKVIIFYIYTSYSITFSLKGEFISDNSSFMQEIVNDVILQDFSSTPSTKT